ncbi:SMP-30/gluconolactonase/LRE family protein [Catenovulum maritimum]|uniref:SMP-30/Gluconolactonase/LRE-like region domain-containing protein n=1 Tax=Catenovulum maritimum TaxID=1513271 RepID=A0A0J8GY08_9ALTE|nr:SMP-30/gluconolactonase/LRE family protein [Catenovulum maritimum]KMT65613.1 hypothetical protein XM47_07905 [Catenovulum maritimum]
MSCDVVLAADVKAKLGEGAIWVEHLNSILFVDILGLSIFQYQLNTQKVSQYATTSQTCWLQITENDNILAGRADGIWLLDQSFNPIKQVSKLPFSEPNIRLNDAKVDNQGRVWFGCMSTLGGEKLGQIYSFSNAKIKVHDDDFFIPNGPAFSPCGHYLYQCDTERKTIYRYQLSTRGQLSNKQILIMFNEQQGYPDGLTVDQDGNLWVAHWMGWGISQYSPEGKVIQFIPLPVARVTCPTFAGKHNNRLFVTTSSLIDENEPLQEVAGGLFEIKVDASGFSPNKAKI